MPRTDLSSYSEGATPEQTESFQPRPEEDPIGVMKPTVEATLVPMDTAPIEEGNPSDAPLLNPTPLSPASAEAATAPPMPAEPVVDAAGDCAAVGGFTISETSSCYLLGDTALSWQDARNFCQAWGGDLVEIGSPEENARLFERIEGRVWIGASDRAEEGTFRWAGGALLEYTRWADGQPNNLQGGEDCAELEGFDDQWNDVPCADAIARQAYCEWPLSSTSGGND
ncbi:MAG: C-type lectin domain-containing protein [Deltaproteobacteria bacterium]